jgi:hypothetical protein
MYAKTLYYAIHNTDKFHTFKIIYAFKGVMSECITGKVTSV